MQKNKTITADSIKKMIAETANYLKKKQEIAKEAEKLENELKTIEESYQGFANSFGFANNPNDVSHITKTGFKNDFHFSRLSKLGAEIQAEMEKQATENPLNEDLIDEVQKLKSHIENLEKENKELKKSK